MAKKKFNIFIILRLIGIILFIIIISKADLKSIFAILKNVDIVFFIYGNIFAGSILLFKAIRWHIMNDTRNSKKYIIRSFGRFFESYALGVITPGRVGELIKTGHETGKNNKATTFIRILSERGFDLGLFLIIAGIALTFNQMVKINNYILFVVIAIGLIILLTAFFLLVSGKFLLKTQKIINKFPGWMSEIELQPKQYSTFHTLLIFMMTFLSILAYFIACYFLAQSVNFNINFLTLSGGVATSGLVNLIPVTIMGMGTREITFLALFKGFDKSVILAFSATMLIVAQIGGGIIGMVLGQYFIHIDKRSSNLD